MPLPLLPPLLLIPQTQIPIKLFEALVQALQRFDTSSSSLQQHWGDIANLTACALHLLLVSKVSAPGEATGQLMPTCAAKQLSASEQRVSAALRQQLDQSGVLEWLPRLLQTAAEELEWCASEVCMDAAGKTNCEAHEIGPMTMHYWQLTAALQLY